MAATSTLPDSQPEETDNPGQDEFDKIIGRSFSPNDERKMEDRAKDGAIDDNAGTPSREDLSDAEQEPDVPLHKDQVGRGYRSTASGKQKGMFNWSGFSPRKKLGVGLGGGLLASGLISLLLLFLPALRLNGYLAGINHRVFATANNAVSNRVQNLFDRYMVTKVISMQRCGNKITGGCRNDYSQMGFAKDLFNSWQDARIENRLFEQYGLEVQSYKNPKDGTERFKIIDKDGRFGKPGDELTVKDGKLVLGKTETGPRIFGREWNKFLKNETRWDQVLQRRSVRKYLVRKHGIKFWCFFACTTKDSIDNAKVSAKTKLKYKLIERTVYPFSQKYGLIMKCLTSGDMSGCSPDNLEKNGLDRSAFSDQDLADLKKFEDKPDLRLSQFLLEKLLIKMGMDEGTSKILVSGVPIAGQLYLVFSIIDTLDTVKSNLENGTLSKIAANVASDQYVEYYTAMRSANDEMLAGKLPEDEAGALVSQFNDGDRPAEQSLVYQAYNAPSKSTASLFSGTALAASSTSQEQPNPYLCSNGKPIPSGQLVCSDKTLDKRSFKIEGYFNDVKGLADAADVYGQCWGQPTFGKCLPPLAYRPRDYLHRFLGGVNWVINNTAGQAVSLALETIKHIPGVGGLIDKLAGYASEFFNAIFNEAFPLPLHPDSPGREKYDALDAGGEITASEFNQGGYTDSGQSYGLGGKLLSGQEEASAAQAYLDQQNYDNSHSGLITRVASIDNPGSLLNRFVAVMPSSWSQFSSGIMSFISSPFHSMGSIWHPAYAAAGPTDINAFGVLRFGYTANDSVFSADPSIYTPQYCDQKKKDWDNSKTQNKTTGVDEYSTTNPCLLEEVAVEAASSVFTQDDDVGDNGSGSNGGIGVRGDSRTIAQQILANKNIDLSAANFCRYCTEDITNTAAGKPAYSDVNIDINILRFLLDLGQNGPVDVNSITGAGTGHSVPNSNHYIGKAIDLACSIDVAKADAIGAKYGIRRNSEKCPDDGHWHYSTDGA
jgi:hypothetical protein